MMKRHDAFGQHSDAVLVSPIGTRRRRLDRMDTVPGRQGGDRAAVLFGGPCDHREVRGEMVTVVGTIEVQRAWRIEW